MDVNDFYTLFRKYGYDYNADESKSLWSLALNPKETGISDEEIENLNNIGTVNDFAMYAVLSYLQSQGKDITAPDAKWNPDDVIAYYKGSDMLDLANAGQTEDVIKNFFGTDGYRGGVDSEIIRIHDYLQGIADGKSEEKLRETFKDNTKGFSLDNPNDAVLIAADDAMDGTDGTYFQTRFKNNLINRYLQEYKDYLSKKFQILLDQSDYKDVALPLMNVAKEPSYLEIKPEIQDVLKAIGKYGSLSINDFLQNIQDNFNKAKSADDYNMTSEQASTLEKIYDDLEMAKAFIYAASKNPS